MKEKDKIKNVLFIIDIISFIISVYGVYLNDYIIYRIIIAILSSILLIYLLTKMFPIYLTVPGIIAVILLVIKMLKRELPKLEVHSISFLEYANQIINKINVKIALSIIAVLLTVALAAVLIRAIIKWKKKKEKIEENKYAHYRENYETWGKLQSKMISDEFNKKLEEAKRDLY